MDVTGVFLSCCVIRDFRLPHIYRGGNGRLREERSLLRLIRTWHKTRTRAEVSRYVLQCPRTFWCVSWTAPQSLRSPSLRAGPVCQARGLGITSWCFFFKWILGDAHAISVLGCGNPLPTRQSLPDACMCMYTDKWKVNMHFYSTWVVNMYRAMVSALWVSCDKLLT